jgi:ABC-type polysaccharide/polyol phosphate transport system ATPase subunit
MAHFDLDSSDEAVQTMMDTYDTDHSGTIEFVEFMNMVMDSSFKKKDQAKMFSAVRTSSVLSVCLLSHSHRAVTFTTCSHAHIIEPHSHIIHCTEYLRSIDLQ